MNIETILKAEKEAVEFIRRCRETRNAAGEGAHCCNNKKTGALRRQSMEHSGDG